MPTYPLPADYVRAVTDYAWKHLVHACDSHHDTDRRLDDCLASELKAERAHRRGHHSTSYRVSAETAARLFVLQHVYETPTSPVDPDVFQHRSEILACYGLGRAMHTTTVHDSNVSRFHAWLDAISAPTPYKGRDGFSSGMLNTLSGEHAANLCEARKRYHQPINIPVVMALDYARDVAGMVH